MKVERNLKFIVKGQSLAKDPTCNFGGIVAETSNYLIGNFSFNSDWNGMNKVAVFKCLNKEYPVKIKDGKCVIPEEALVWSKFFVYVIGQNKNGVRITTNIIAVNQEVL